MIESRPTRFFYGYYIVLAGFFMVGLSYTAGSTFGVFFEPLIKEFGWTRAVTSGAMSLAAVTGAIFNIISGKLTDRFSPRLILSIGTCFLGLGIIGLSQINAAWQLFACFCLIAVGGSCYLVPLTSTVARWFVKRRGMMTSILIASLGTCELVMPPVARWLITAYGWRHAYLILGIAIFLVILLAAQFIRRDPGKMGLTPYGVSQEKQVNIKLQTGGLSLQEALHTREFWLFVVILICYFFGMAAVATHVVIYATGMGISPVKAAAILSIAGGMHVVCINIGGNIADRFGKKVVILSGFVMQAVALLGFMAASELWHLYLCALVFGAGRGTATAPMPLLMADIFGLKSFGVIQGAAFSGSTIGSIIGPILVGYIFDISGVYFYGFLICAAMTALAVVMTFFIRSRPELSKNT
jgi:MFS transporter, OFA family, oxalate/formate antiporter